MVLFLLTPVRAYELPDLNGNRYEQGPKAGAKAENQTELGTPYTSPRDVASDIARHPLYWRYVNHSTPQASLWKFTGFPVYVTVPSENAIAARMPLKSACPWRIVISRMIPEDSRPARSSGSPHPPLYTDC